MTAHTTCFVPLEVWAYGAPRLAAEGRQANFGLLAEALLYYERVLLEVGNAACFAELIRRLVKEDSLADFRALISDGTIHLYEYAFISTAVKLRSGAFGLFNVQDEEQLEPKTFRQRILKHDLVRNAFPSPRVRRKFTRAVLDRRVTEVKASEFGSSVGNARDDVFEPRRSALIVQAFVDEVFRMRDAGQPPEVSAVVRGAPSHDQRRVTYNIDFDAVANIAGDAVGFHDGTPLVAAALANRDLWTASREKCDLFLPSPFSCLVGDKLYEADRLLRPTSIIESLQEEVDFPDIQRFVNEERLRLGDVLALRKKAGKFREWLQTESERDRNAIIAYHHEVAKESSTTSVGRKALRLFGVLGGAAVGAATGGMPGAVAGAGVNYLASLAAGLREDWRPVVFGDWLRARIERVLASHDSAAG
ncbi:MAG: hypothetical protein AAF533_28605 [Acidobacteriota bacterium]